MSTGNRRPGRPRDEQLTEALVTAAQEILAADGFAALTLERVARRAGASRTAIYKRWSNRADLLLAVATRVLSGAQPGGGAMVAPGAGSLAGDLRAFVLQGMDTLDRLEEVGVAQPLLAESILSTSLGNRAREELFRGDEAALRSIVEAAVERGELAELPPDLGAVFFALVGYALYRKHILHLRLDDDELDALCRLLVRGLQGA